MEIEQENGRDDDVIEVKEYMKSEKTPKNTKLDDFYKLYQYCNDNSKSTISVNYSNGDNRGDLSKKFSDYVDLYNYVYDSIKTPQLKEEFHRYFGTAINRLLYGKEVDSIELNLLMEKELCEADRELITSEYCKGYIVRIENSENDYYGFLIIKLKDKKRSNESYVTYFDNKFKIIPFVVNKEFKCILSRFIYDTEEVGKLDLSSMDNVIKLTRNIINYFNREMHYMFSDKIFIPDFMGKTVTFNSII